VHKQARCTQPAAVLSQVVPRRATKGPQTRFTVTILVEASALYRIEPLLQVLRTTGGDDRGCSSYSKVNNRRDLDSESQRLVGGL